ncbi:putative high-affinity choline transporter 1-like [Scophthalmus maximus]|uniref:Putative high-affinity choline transporter 1-like n=1 Tax=Scophthalmus maximus TaxID=52904 RepID=A0A2U9CDF2_SCOMX|nr:putative high-affinity choline transporter 1-like [Scophthalmus maximus]
MAANIPRVILMVLFYLLVLGTGIWASFKSKREKKKSGANAMEMTLLGNRSINWMVGIFTMTGEESKAENNKMDAAGLSQGLWDA